MLEKLFGSRTRVKVLALLLNNSTRAYYVREITRKVDEQINSVRRELANLKSVGLVRSYAKNGKIYFQANTKADIFAEMKKIFGKVAKEVAYENVLGEKLKSAGAVQYAALMGYFVQDASCPIDLFLIGNIEKAKLKPIIKDLSDEIGHEVNFTTMTPEEFTERNMLFDRFLTEIMAAQKVVVIDYLGVSKGE